MNDTASFDKFTYASMMLHAKQAYPREGCGVLLCNRENGRIEKLKSMANTVDEESGGTHFMIDPLELYRLESEAESEGRVIAGFYHSHPDRRAILSEEDKEYLIPEMLYVVVSTGRYGIGDIKGYVKNDTGEKISEVSIWEV